jgi:hypothetical protein
MLLSETLIARCPTAELARFRFPMFVEIARDSGEISASETARGRTANSGAPCSRSLGITRMCVCCSCDRGMGMRAVIGAHIPSTTTIQQPPASSPLTSNPTLPDPTNATPISVHTETAPGAEKIPDYSRTKDVCVPAVGVMGER